MAKIMRNLVAAVLLAGGIVVSTGTISMWW